MTDSNNEHKLQLAINKFDPKIKLHELKSLQYQQLVNWIESYQKLIDDFKDHWKSKIDIHAKIECQRTYKSTYANENFIIRCFDEEEAHLNNAIGLARFTAPKDKKRGLHYYTWPFNEWIAFQLAKAFEWQVQETNLAVLTSSSFHTLLDRPSEKICSLQEQLTSVEDPLEYILRFFQERKDRSVKAILADLNDSIDLQAFEDAFLFSWLAGEMNGSPSKYLLTQKANGKRAFIKSNSSTCFSCNYFETDSFLLAFPHLNQPLSPINQEKILSFKEDSILKIMRQFGKEESSISCFKDRLRRMQMLAKESSLPLRAFVPIGWRKNHWKLESFLLKLYHEGIAFS